jgi:SAM-dependent methyltransferase
MALTETLLDLVLDGVEEGDAVVSLGYPDIVYPPDKLREILGDKILALKYREDSEAICKRHGISKRDIPDAESLFECLGATLDVFDIVQERGCEIVVDLNHPIPANACGQFDFVLDVGTLEHCFNVPQALINMAALAKVGGYVLHENPFNWGNHGFWNLNPTLFHDFYTDNGFEAVSCWLKPRGSTETFTAPWTKRFQWGKGEANLITVVKRVEEKEFTFPCQTKYRR